MTTACELCGAVIKPLQTYVSAVPSELIVVELTAKSAPEEYGDLEVWTRHTPRRCRAAREGVAS